MNNAPPNNPYGYHHHYGGQSAQGTFQQEAAAQGQEGHSDLYPAKPYLTVSIEQIQARQNILRPQVDLIEQAAESNSGTGFTHSNLGASGASSASSASIRSNIVAQPRSTAFLNYSNEIDTFFSSLNKNSPAEIVHRVASLQQHTNHYLHEPIPLKTNLYGNRAGQDYVFLCIATYSPPDDTYDISLSGRINYSSFNLSDACLAQLGRVMPRDNNYFPVSLPQKIVRKEIVNMQTKAVIDHIYSQRGADDNTAITIQQSRTNPELLDNQQLYNLLTNTPNGKSTAHIISDFNRVNNTDYKIEVAGIHKQPNYQLDFTLRH